MIYCADCNMYVTPGMGCLCTKYGFYRAGCRWDPPEARQMQEKIVCTCHVLVCAIHDPVTPEPQKSR